MLPTLSLVLLAAFAATAAWMPLPRSAPPSLAVLGASTLLFGGPGLVASAAGFLVGLLLHAWRTASPDTPPRLVGDLVHLAVVVAVVGAAARVLDPQIHSFATAIAVLLLLAVGGTAATTGVVALRQWRQSRARLWLAWRLSALHATAFTAAGLVVLWSLGQLGHLAGFGLGLTLLAWMAWALRPTFAVATQTARAHRAESEARLDPLTVLPNRRALEEYVADIQVAGLPAVVAIADVDHFKRVNDTYGHDAGDAVLFAVAQRLRHACRQTANPWPDKVGRWGGEEFVLILPCLPPEAAASRVESVRRAVSASPIRHGGQAIAITCSIGATACAHTFNLVDAVTRADQGLLAAKAQGRDRVVWEPPLATPGLTLRFVPEDPTSAAPS